MAPRVRSIVAYMGLRVCTIKRFCVCVDGNTGGMGGFGGWYNIIVQHVCPQIAIVCDGFASSTVATAAPSEPGKWAHRTRTIRPAQCYSAHARHSTPLYMT